MKTSSLKKSIAFAAVAALALIPNLRANTAVNVFIEGGSASRSVLYDRATNLLFGTTFTSTGNGKSNVRRFTGTNAALPGLDITLDINVNNGAIAGFAALVGSPGASDTNVLGVPTKPTFVDSATSPEANEIDSVANNLIDLPTYVVPLVYIKNTNSPDIASITNLTQRQAVSLETDTNKTTFYGGTNPATVVYFVGRNNQSAVRTEIDYSIYNVGNTIKTFTNNNLNLPVQDRSSDPGASSASALVAVVQALTNSIGTVAVQDAGTLPTIAFEGVSYSVTNVINGSYPLWGYEHYYYISSPNAGAPTANQQLVLNAFYSSVTNAAFQNISNPTFTNFFIPNSALRVSRGFDGDQIKPNANY